MKKVTETVRPYLSIIFGALLFLVYLNYLQLRGANLALGIIGVIISSYYIALGIITVLIGKKLPKVLDLITVALYPVFLFVSFLITVILNYEDLGPTAWVINILGMVASLTFATLYIIAGFVKNKVLQRITFLFMALLGLSLLLDLLFRWNGMPIALGDFSLISFALYFLYGVILFNSLSKAKEEPAKEEAPAETKEEAPEEATEDPEEEVEIKEEEAE